MSLDLKLLDNSSDIPDNYKYYWKYQYRLGDEVIVPYLESLGAYRQGMNVFEIGAAEGGVLAAFASRGAAKALGSDIVAHRIDQGDKIRKILGYELELVNHNIVIEEPRPDWVGVYDLALLRDVIEHLDDAVAALVNIKKMLKPGGMLYVTFPPYHSPFGGHQHTVANRWGKLPYIHLLPDSIFHKMIEGGRAADIAEVKRLQNIRLTPHKFTTAAKKAGFDIIKEDFYFLRPVYKMKFGLPTIKLTAISGLPLVKNLFSLEASYLLRK